VSTEAVGPASQRASGNTAVAHVARLDKTNLPFRVDRCLPSPAVDLKSAKPVVAVLFYVCACSLLTVCRAAIVECQKEEEELRINFIEYAYLLAKFGSKPHKNVGLQTAKPKQTHLGTGCTTVGIFPNGKPNGNRHRTLQRRVRMSFIWSFRQLMLD